MVAPELSPPPPPGVAVGAPSPVVGGGDVVVVEVVVVLLLLLVVVVVVVVVVVYPGQQTLLRSSTHGGSIAIGVTLGGQLMPASFIASRQFRFAQQCFNAIAMSGVPDGSGMGSRLAPVGSS